MNRRLTLYVATCLLMCSLSSAFAPIVNRHKSFQRARLVPASTVMSYRGRVLLMSEEPEGETSGEAVVSEGETSEEAVVSKPAPTSGTFYDDEVNPEPAEKQGISESMRERLIREATTGLDAEKKQMNVLLYIMVGVGLLVILGGQGIFY